MSRPPVALAYKGVPSRRGVLEPEKEAGALGHQGGAPQLPGGLQESTDLRCQGIAWEGHGMDTMVRREELHAVPRVGLDEGRHRVLPGSPPSQSHTMQPGPVRKAESPGFFHPGIRLPTAGEATARKGEKHDGESKEASPPAGDQPP
jgi:hypothetical protein